MLFLDNASANLHETFKLSTSADGVSVAMLVLKRSTIEVKSVHGYLLIKVLPHLSCWVNPIDCSVVISTCVKCITTTVYVF
jgi:hypothetical protein